MWFTAAKNKYREKSCTRKRYGNPSAMSEFSTSRTQILFSLCEFSYEVLQCLNQMVCTKGDNFSFPLMKEGHQGTDLENESQASVSIAISSSPQVRVFVLILKKQKNEETSFYFGN